MKELEVTRVTPLRDSPIDSVSEFSRPLTLFDTFWYRFSPVEFVFFYPVAESTLTLFNSVIVPKLKHSLSLTLLHYLPLAGYLTWPPTSPKPLILYTQNDGVSFTVAESSADFDRLAGGGTIPAADLHPLVPRLNSSDEKAEILSLQITLFPNKGFSIGQTNHHSALDGNSVTRFTKSWAYICRKISNDLTEKYVPLPEELSPSFNSNLIKDPTGQDMLFLNQWREITGSDAEERSVKILHQLGTIPPDVVRATFKFTRSNIATLKAKILSKLEQRKKQVQLSTYVVVVACMATCLIRCKQEREEETVLFTCTADFRQRLDPPLPATYCGSCVGGRLSKVTNFTREDGLAFAAECQSDLVKRVNEGVIESSGEIEVSDLSLPELFAEVHARERKHVISVAGSNRFGVYKSDFGWGRPGKVEIVTVDRTGGISMTESRDEIGGVEASLALKRQEMETFAALFADGVKDS